jgi:hypothetical protein
MNLTMENTRKEIVKTQKIISKGKNIGELIWKFNLKIQISLDIMELNLMKAQIAKYMLRMAMLPII